MSHHGESRFDIQMRCMCAPFSTTRSQTCTSGFKVSVTVLQLGNRPYIFFHKNTPTRLYFSDTWAHSFCAHTPQFQSTSTITSPHKLHKCVPQREPILWVHYHFCFLFLYFAYEFDYNFSGRKQPCILHLLLFLKQQHRLYPVCHRPLPPLISAVSPLSHTIFWCAAMPVKFVVPAVSLHLSPFTFSHFYMAWHSLLHSSTSLTNWSCRAHCTLFPWHTCIILHIHITRYHISFQSHTDMFMKTTQVFRLATNHTTQFTLIQIK